MTKVDEARRELILRTRHAFGHSHPNGAHHDLNIDGFLRELERFIDAKLDERLTAVANRIMRKRR